MVYVRKRENKRGHILTLNMPISLYKKIEYISRKKGVSITGIMYEIIHKFCIYEDVKYHVKEDSKWKTL